MNHSRVHYSKVLLLLLATTVLPVSSVLADDHAGCGDPATPLLAVADFNGDGAVNGKDIALLAREIGSGAYLALYDRNADGRLDNADVVLASADIGKTSGDTDQRLARMYQRFKHFQDLSGFEQLQAMGYLPFGSVLAGHGQHWFNNAGIAAISGLKPADPNIAEGLNVLTDGSDIPALFWGEAATPLFTDPTSASGMSTLDWPTHGGAWETQRVMAFADTPPDFFPGSENDRWHTHGGLCGTVQDFGNGPVLLAQQHMTFAECQALPNLMPFEIDGRLVNAWVNIWMLHVWLYDLNPNGTHGNTHPCIEPNGVSEEDLSGGREIPPFFQHHG